LYFLPLPQGQSSLRPGRQSGRARRRHQRSAHPAGAIRDAARGRQQL